jgi:hypothetical protein
MTADITMLQRPRARSSTLENNNESMNQLQPMSTSSWASLLPFISISTLDLCPFQLHSTSSTEKLPHTLLAPTCSPHSLSRIEEILTSWPTHPMVIPCSLMFLVVIIQGYFPMIPFLIPSCIFLILGETNKSQANVHSIESRLGA